MSRIILNSIIDTLSIKSAGLRLWFQTWLLLKSEEHKKTKEI